MKNLENYGVVSLDTKEMMEIDGGLSGEDAWAIVCSILIIIAIILL